MGAGGILSASPRYDVKPARFVLNQGSRKLYSGGVTCPGLIRLAGPEHIQNRKLLRSKKSCGGLPGNKC